MPFFTTSLFSSQTTHNPVKHGGKLIRYKYLQHWWLCTLIKCVLYWRYLCYICVARSLICSYYFLILTVNCSVIFTLQSSLPPPVKNWVRRLFVHNKKLIKIKVSPKGWQQETDNFVNYIYFSIYTMLEQDVPRCCSLFNNFMVH